MEQINQFKNFSSWRVQDVTLHKGVNTVDFNDTMPNQFVVQNPTGIKLFSSISNIPTDINYEFMIGRNTTVPLGRPTPTKKIYFYNPTDGDINIKLFSVYLPFDLSSINNNTLTIESAEISTDGIVRGFQSGVSLPTGNNVIGKVGLSGKELSYLEEIYNFFLNNGMELMEQLESLRVLNSDIRKFNRLQSFIEMPEYHSEINMVYENNVMEINFTAPEAGVFVFNYLINDAQNHCQIIKNDTDYIFTILEGEKISDWKCRLEAGDKITVTGNDLLLRAQHYFVPFSVGSDN